MGERFDEFEGFFPIVVVMIECRIEQAMLLKGQDVQSGAAQQFQFPPIREAVAVADASKTGGVDLDVPIFGPPLQGWESCGI